MLISAILVLPLPALAAGTDGTVRVNSTVRGCRTHALNRTEAEMKSKGVERTLPAALTGLSDVSVRLGNGCQDGLKVISAVKGDGSVWALISTLCGVK